MAENGNNVNTQTSNGTSTAWQIIGRLIAAAIILAITAFFTPGFQINNFWSLAVAAVVLTVLDYLIVTQYFVAGYSISWVASIIGALIYGVIDYFIPGEQNM